MKTMQEKKEMMDWSELHIFFLYNLHSKPCSSGLYKYKIARKGFISFAKVDMVGFYLPYFRV